MNQTRYRPTPAHRYLRYLAGCAHEAGLPYLPIDGLSPRQVNEWIDYLRSVISARERVQELLHESECRVKQDAYLVTPPREQLPDSYVPPWQDLSPALDHEHLVGTVRREDGIEESVCVLCSSST